MMTRGNRIYARVGGGFAVLVRITNFVLVLALALRAEVMRRSHGCQLISGIATEEIAAEEIVQLPMRETNSNSMPAR